MKPKMLYFTLADQPSSVYKTQAVEVVTHLREELGADIRLAALVSFRGYYKARKLIKSWDKSAIVLPMLPQLKHWKKNTFILKLLIRILKPKAIIGRGIFGTGLALLARNEHTKVCFDGRGAIHAEAMEYNVYEEPIKSQTFEIEKNVILNSDFRVAVSSKLVEHWNQKYGYIEQNHIIIPCTYNSENSITGMSKESILSDLNWNENDKIIVFSGSISAWQSFETLKKLLNSFLAKDPSIKILFLSPEHPEIQGLENSYKTQVKRRWLKQEEVASYLKTADYGVLFREDSVTSAVAAPVKFAEYLSAGLKVLISKNIGDYSDLVESQNLGHVISIKNVSELTLNKINTGTKEKLQSFGYKIFHKKSEKILAAYQDLINSIS